VPKVSTLYTSQFLNASELPNHRIAAVIVRAEGETVGQGEQAAMKIVLELRAADGRLWGKRVVLNKSNAMLIAAAFGDDTADWRNCPIEVWKEKVMFSGRLVDGIRMQPAAKPAGNGGAVVTAPPLAAPRTAMPAPAAIPESPPQPLHEALDDDIPF
jgi:hypothetical protein